MMQKGYNGIKIGENEYYSAYKSAIKTSAVDLSQITQVAAQEFLTAVQWWMNTRASGIIDVKRDIKAFANKSLEILEAAFYDLSRRTTSDMARRVFKRAGWFIGEFFEYMENENNLLTKNDEDEFRERIEDMMKFLDISKDRLAVAARKLALEARLYKDKKKRDESDVY